jgi:hypothetical protein
MQGSKAERLRLFYKVALLLLASVVSYLVLLCVCYVSVRDQNSYVAAQLDKVTLLRNTPSPRVVLVGGSALAFGIDSSAVSRAVGLPVINTGVHAGLGLRYLLRSAEESLRPGDIVAVVPEYEQFTGTTFDGDVLLLRLCALRFDRTALLCLRPSTLLKGNVGIFEWKPKTTTERTSRVGDEFTYARSNFGPDGDEICHLGLPNRPFIPVVKFNPELNLEAFRELSAFIEERGRSGVKVAFAFPPLIRGCYVANELTIRKVVNELAKRIPQSRWMQPESAVYDERYFFDTHYHLNAEGRAKMTENLIRAVVLSMKARPT